MGLMDTLRAKYELYRLEQRYTKRDKRTTFSSGAQYVDGEYVYNAAAFGAKSASASPTNKSRMSVVNVKELFPSTSGRHEARRGELLAICYDGYESVGCHSMRHVKWYVWGPRYLLAVGPPGLDQASQRLAVASRCGASVAGGTRDRDRRAEEGCTDPGSAAVDSCKVQVPRREV